MANLFEAAASNPSLMTEIVDAMRSAASSVGVALPDEAAQFVQLASENATFKASLQSQVSQVAAAHGLAFEPEASVSVSSARAQLDAFKNNPTQIPVGTPIALLFISADLLFMPSVIATAGATMFGRGDTAGGVDGVETFE